MARQDNFTEGLVFLKIIVYNHFNWGACVTG